jgi:hypothetical protein
MQLLRTHLITDPTKDVRYYIDGKRVTFEKYNNTINKAATHDCFVTQLKKNRYYHYSSAIIKVNKII